MTDALFKIGILIITTLGVVTGAIWFFFRPQVFKRGLESVSQNRSTRLPTFAAWGMGLAALSIPVIALLSALSDSQGSPSKTRVKVSANESSGPVVESSTSSASLPVAFNSRYDRNFVRPLPRIWKETNEGVWTESYAGQISNVFDSEGTIVVDGCVGLLLKKRKEDAFEVFVPSSGCLPLLQFRWKQGPWQPLGPIDDPVMSNKD